VFDLSFTKILVLAVIALVVFGPNELPKVASQAGRMLRDLRRIAEGAKSDLKEGLGPEFQDFDFDDLNPRRFVQKHLLDEPGNMPEPVGTPVANGVAVNGAAANGVAVSGAAAVATAGTADSVTASEVSSVLGEDENPPFDFDAT
jgi:sec-independent protein translocase protein TatB